ncbi:hypothetical protein QTG54_012908 [Skeletonema marinoi]|uniref:Subtilisin n=1 Tax=Skeletonema marinoi TaxID=267567 RepID=A0AAD8XZH2_9STRA|nr:hypothetical protein QTG54_012908 [Skeletonema marinoi]
MLPKAVLLILAAATTLALSAVAVEAVQSLRAPTIATKNNSDSFLNHILRRLFNFDKDQYQYKLQEGLKNRTGFSLGRSFISTNHDDNMTNVKYIGDTLDNRDLRADNSTRYKLPEYTFTPCADEYECDSTIVTYTREEVYIKVSSELKQSTNVQYCLTADPMITTDMYGSCGVQEDCACAYCIFGSWCVFQVCDSQCYELSGLDTEVATAVKHGVQVRKVCASCEEETNHPGFTNEDSDGIGYCDSDAYVYEAKNSGLVVFPTDDEGTILPGALSVSAWAHVTIAGTCDTPTGTFKPSDHGKISIDATTTLLMGASGTVAIAPDTLGYSNTYDYFKGYIVKKQYQTSFIPLWLKTKRTIAEETNCGGYGAFAIAEAAESAGIDIQAVLSGAGPYLTSSALLTTGYTAMVDGQDLLADSWFVGSTQYTKYDAINAVTNLGGSNRLNKLVPSPINIDSLDVWNLAAVKFFKDAMSEGLLKPCDNIDGAAAAGVDRLCQALQASDLEHYINSIGTKYSYELCFSYDDDVIDSANVLQGGPAFTNNAFEVTGNHDEAGTHCIRRFVNYFDSPNFTSYVPQRTGGYCGVNGSASSSSQPSSGPSSSLSYEPSGSTSNHPSSVPRSLPSPRPSETQSHQPSSSPSTSPSFGPSESPSTSSSSESSES